MSQPAGERGNNRVVQSVFGKLKVPQPTNKRRKNAPPLFANGLVYCLFKRERGQHKVIQLATLA